MANIIGAITTSHIPAIANAMANGLEETPYWKPFLMVIRQCVTG